MHKNIARGLVAVAAGAALSVAGGSGASAPGLATSAAQAARAPAVGTPQAAVPGTQLWIKRYNTSGNRDDYASSVAVSPGGGRVFVTGSSTRAGAGAGPGDYVTIAYNTATGGQSWVKRYNGPGTSWDDAAAAAVSPNGRTVFVTGFSTRTQGGPSDYATVAYNAATGAQVWVKRYRAYRNSSGGATSVTVSPGGGTVFVTGYSGGPRADSAGDYATIAYNTATGARRWVKRYNGPGNSNDGGTSVAVSPGGGRVFVTGSSDGDYATVAYNAGTGARLWVKRYPGPSNPRDDGGATSVAVSPSGKTVFVTGTSFGPNSHTDYATVAYNAATGAQLWAKHYNGPAGNDERAASLAVSPGGGRVFVTGASDGDFATVAYDATTGAQLWVKRYNGPGNLDDFGASIAVSPGGKTVFVTGPSTGTARVGDAATIAYNAATGARLWLKRYTGPRNRGAVATSVAVSPHGGTVFVTGSSIGRTTGADFTTIAYRG